MNFSIRRRNTKCMEMDMCGYILMDTPTKLVLGGSVLKVYGSPQNMLFTDRM